MCNSMLKYQAKLPTQRYPECGRGNLVEEVMTSLETEDVFNRSVYCSLMYQGESKI